MAKSKREKILQQIHECENNRHIADLRGELADLQDRIAKHELIQMQNRTVRCALEIEQAEFARMRTLNRLECELQQEEPQQVFDLRVMLRAAFDRHCLTDPPIILRDRQGNAQNWAEFASWRDRGQSLLACCNLLTGMWKVADTQAALRQMVAEHGKVLPELRHTFIAEQEFEHAAI